MPSAPVPTPAMLANPWYADLPESYRQALLSTSRTVRLQAGQTLYRNGSAAGDFFCVMSGSFKLSTVLENGREGILAMIDAGNWFGEIGLLDGLPRSHDATALEPTQVLVLDAAEFDKLMASPGFARAMCLLLSSRLRLLFGAMEDSMCRTTGERLARRLLLLARGDPAALAQSRTHLPVSQEALAMMLGVTRATLAKELKMLEREGVLRIGYGRIEILSLAALEQHSLPD